MQFVKIRHIRGTMKDKENSNYGENKYHKITFLYPIPQILFLTQRQSLMGAFLLFCKYFRRFILMGK